MMPKPCAEAAREAFPATPAVRLVTAANMDKWRLDRTAVRPILTTEVNKALGFN